MNRFVVETVVPTPLDVYVDREEFDQADSGKAIYGYIKKHDGTKMVKRPVYVDLGKERPISKRSKDPKTEFRRFINCEVSIFEKESDMDDLEKPPWIGPIPNQQVILIGS